jgi:lysophospholipase L1-like esterase
MKYVALGDSYTIGMGASEESQNFPSHLVRKLEAGASVKVELTNPAVNGYTSEDLVRTELDDLERVKPQLVSVLVGANDVVQGRNAESYRASLVKIYETIARLEPRPSSVLSVSMPDWSAAPAASLYGKPQEIREQIDAFNAIAREESEKRRFTFADITELSRSHLQEPGWISADDLHPADAQYKAWADYLWGLVGPAWERAASA